MFTSEELQLLNAAIDMAIASQKRAQNSNKNPKFIPIFQSLLHDYEALKVKLNTPSAQVGQRNK